MRAKIIFSLLICLLVVSPLYADQQSLSNFEIEKTENQPFSIEIGRTEDAMLGTHVLVPVTKVIGDAEIHGFDFIISYDRASLFFMGAYGNSDIFEIPGEYEWEYFTYRFVDNCGGECPSGLLRIVAMGNTNDGIHEPVNVTLPYNTTLFTMDFMISNDYTLDCQFLPIDFFWRDCFDNSISAVLQGGSIYDLFIAGSSDVYSGFDYSAITDTWTSFPTFYGVPDECLDTLARYPVVRFIDFYNGGVTVHCHTCCDRRGDINLNGKEYEIADALVFTSYFIYGFYAFTINIDGQTAATDVNADGVPLTIEDLVQLIRVAVGDITPPAKNASTEYNSGTLDIQYYNNNISISGSFDKDVGAIHLCFYAPGFGYSAKLGDQYADKLLMKHDKIDDSLKILIYSFDRETISSADSDILNIEYSGTKPTLIYASAAGDDGEKINLESFIIPDDPILSQNVPNPFNPNTEIKFSLPHSSDVTLNIFDITGRKVTNLVNKILTAGAHSVIWNGRDESGNEVASGVYLYRISTEKYSDTKKMLLLK
ncbi:MAG: T9SS type A sorting domain-containing protein [candidate division Zixibacteria bacterium]|nr:T9SS type A sorting domain-containing protein [candidate division Zixibacteria bacterium]